jgi:polysaccharide biosynthesis transport protein
MSFLRRYALWIVCVTVACLAGSWAFAASRPAQFSASASVDVEPNVIVGGVPVTPILATEMQVATSGNVLSAAAPTLGMTEQDLAKHVSTSNKAGTNILQITCSQPTAAAAQSCANAVATAYTKYRNETSSPKAIQQRAPYHVTIVTYAPLPTAKSSKRKVELLAIGVIVGLMLGVGTAYLRDRLDDRVRDRDDLARCLKAPVLTDIPAVRRRSARPEAGVIHAPWSPLAEAYRHLRARITPAIASTDSQGKVLLVTSAQAGEGRTSVAINLAAVMASTGIKVLLVDADLRNQTLSHRFQVRGERGLTDLVVGGARVGDVIMSADLAPGLSFMAAGTSAHLPGDLLDTARLQRTFAQLRVIADLIIVDSGPVRAVSDPLALVTVTDIVIMVADVRRTRRAAVTAAAEEVRATGTATLAGVLNRVRQPWKRDRAKPRRMGSLTGAFSTLRGGRENGSRLGASPNGIPKAGWRNPADAEGAAGMGSPRSDESAAPATELAEPPPAHDESGPGEDQTMRFGTVLPSAERPADATGADTGPNGDGPDEINTVAGRGAPN